MLDLATCIIAFENSRLNFYFEITPMSSQIHASSCGDCHARLYQVA